MKTIVNTNVILEDGIIWNGVVEFEGEKITFVGKRENYDVPKNAEIIDAKGLYTAPGLIDIHNHGSVNDLFANEPLKCCEYFIRHGETTVLPTFYQDLNAEQIINGAEKIRELSKNGVGRIMDGLYMEGPYMNMTGSNNKYLLWGGDILPEEYIPIVEKIKNDVRIWAIDPARKGIEGFMFYVKEKNPNAIFALGHSNATAEQCRRIYKYGVKVQTHHGDSGQAKGLAQGTPGAGCDEFTLYNPDMYAELICDEVGIHVVPDRIKMIVRTKGVERIVLITDSMPERGRYKNDEKKGVAYGPDLNYDYEGKLAGSHLTLDKACRNLMAHTGYGLCHAIRFASINPARLLGIDDKVGSVEQGKIANLILIDDKVNVKKVFLYGDFISDN